MSVAEIKAELPSLSPAELAEVETALQQAKQGDSPDAGAPLRAFFGCARGTITFLPGWDEPDTELWNALKDDLPL
ncbi:hypothetical protein EBZ70_09795 [bacterium]|jgi:hypothetical protein|nr:hypothetical protein [bacterium]